MSFCLNSPILARTVYAAQERLVGRPTFDYARRIEESQWLSREGVEALQMSKLGALLKIAVDHCPWHAARIRAASIDPNVPLTMDDLRKISPMTKADARNHIEGLCWKGVPGGAFSYNTGGSSGQPLVFCFGRWRQASDAAGRMRARRWWGVEVGEPEVYLWGAPVELNKTDHIKRFRDRLLNQLVLNAFAMSPENMDRFVEHIRAFKPKCIYGYATSIALLAAHASDRGMDLGIPGLRVVCTTGEPLYPHQRKLIEEVYGVPAANEFGSRDIGFTAHESPEGQMLLMSESIVLEVLNEDGEPVADGELGEAVMTGLCSDAQPFIRYRTGDIVKLSKERCKAGRGLHVIEEVTGRSTDFVTRSDGTIMHALAVIYAIRPVTGVGEFKFVQNSLKDFDVWVVPTNGWGLESMGAIRGGLEARLGPDARIVIKAVDEIKPEASGKHRYVVSRVPVRTGLAGAMGLETANEINVNRP